MFKPKLAAISIALAATALTFGAALAPNAAEARAQGVYYTAQLASPTTETQLISRGVVWQCNGSTCIAARNNSRPITVCKRLAREVGAIDTFMADGEELSADRLAKCND